MNGVLRDRDSGAKHSTGRVGLLAVVTGFFLQALFRMAVTQHVKRFNEFATLPVISGLSHLAGCVSLSVMAEDFGCVRRLWHAN